MLDVPGCEQYAVRDLCRDSETLDNDRWRPATLILMEPSSFSLTEALSDGAKRWILHVQEYSLLSARSITSLFSPPYYVSDVLDQMDIIGVGSLPIVLLTGFFIGAVMVLQTAAQFERFGQTALTADVVSLALVRELGPSITGLLVAGRNASGMASELGSMIVTEQVDAMRAMGTDPVRKLVTPRMLATVLMLPLLTAMADFLGVDRRIPWFPFSRCGSEQWHSGPGRSTFWNFRT